MINVQFPISIRLLLVYFLIWKQGNAVRVLRVVGGSVVACENPVGFSMCDCLACENPVGFSMCDCPIETVKYIWVNIWCMLDWILSQNCRNTTSLDAVVPYQLLAANIDGVAYQMEEYLKIQVWLWFCIVWIVFNTTTTCHFHYYMHCLGKNHKINAVCFLLFHNGCQSCMQSVT